MTKAQRLLVAQLCEFEAGHEIYKDLLGQPDVGKDLQSGVRLSKADVLNMYVNGRTIFEYPNMLKHFDRIAAAVAETSNGEEFNARDLSRPLGGQRSILDYAERAGALDKVFSPAVWLGRDAEMQATFFELPRFSRAAMKLLELRRAVAVASGTKLREDRLIEMGMPPADLSGLLQKGDLDTIQKRLAPFGERLRREDVMLIDDLGETVLTSNKEIWNHIEKIQEVLTANGEPLGAKEFLFRVADKNAAVDSARQYQAMPQLFSPAVWRDRPEDMIELHRHVTDAISHGVDIRKTLADVLDRSAQGAAHLTGPATIERLTTAFNCKAVPGAQIQASFRPLGLRNTWNNIGELRSELRSRGQKITLAHLQLPSGIGEDTCLTNAVRYGRLAEVLDILDESGERLTLNDLTARKTDSSENLLTLIGSTKQLEMLFRPQNWVSHGKEMQDVWKNVPLLLRDSVDFSDIQSEVNRLSLRRAAGIAPKP